MHYAEQNSYYLTKLKAVLERKGYKTSGYWIDYTYSSSTMALHYYIEGRDTETRKEFIIPYRCVAQPDDDADDKAAKLISFEHCRTDLERIPDSSFAMRNLVLEMLDKIRTIMPEVDLPPGFINPIEELAEALRSNILEGPKPSIATITGDETIKF